MELLYMILTMPVRIFLYGAGLMGLVIIVWALTQLPEMWREMSRPEDEE